MLYSSVRRATPSGVSFCLKRMVISITSSSVPLIPSISTCRSECVKAFPPSSLLAVEREATLPMRALNFISTSSISKWLCDHERHQRHVQFPVGHLYFLRHRDAVVLLPEAEQVLSLLRLQEFLRPVHRIVQTFQDVRQCIFLFLIE